MTLINKENTLLLSLFVPKVRTFGWTNVYLNDKEMPTVEQILFFMYEHFDLGVIHCCREFDIPGLPSELTHCVCDYLYPSQPSSSSAYCFWNWLYLDQLYHLYTNDEYSLLIYGEEYSYKYAITCVRLYRIQEKIDLCYQRTTM
jgi:hypothetical protein